MEVVSTSCLGILMTPQARVAPSRRQLVLEGLAETLFSSPVLVFRGRAVTLEFLLAKDPHQVAV